MIDLISRSYRKKCMEIRQVIEATQLSEEAALHLEGVPEAPLCASRADTSTQRDT